MREFMFPIMLSLGGCLIVLEHVFPAHPLNRKAEWYVRAVLINALQVLVFMTVAVISSDSSATASLYRLEGMVSPVLGAFIAYVIFTFVEYWWHRLRHSSEIVWRVFHQFHHSPQRIQTLTAYYMHPLDMAVSLCISNMILFPLLGLGSEAASWYLLISGVAGFLIHANIRVPRQVGYIFQTPEMHRLHHMSGHHAHNYSDIALWDQLFGTYLNPVQPIDQCGFDEAAELQVIPMLLGRNIHAQ
jgi:sterol desaturase/sphingolipid hydroxylase (fatty acid hydroxylase superfamily)